MVGDDRQNFERGARQLLLLHRVAAHQEGEIAGGAEGPAIADAHQIDAAPRIDVLQFGHGGGDVDAVRQALGELLLADRLGAGEDNDGLGHARGFGQMQPLGRVLSQGVVLVIRLEGPIFEGNDRSVAAFAHCATSTALARWRPRR